MALCPPVIPLLGRDTEGLLKVWDEESGELHRELGGFEHCCVEALATFLSADGQQPRLVAGSLGGDLRVYDPEAGSVLHRLDGHMYRVSALACTASSSAAPHHPRLVSASLDGTVKVWDGETGEWLADLGDHGGAVRSMAVWKEHTGGHDRIATAGDLVVKVWDGEALTLLHDLSSGGLSIREVSAFESAEGPTRLLVATSIGEGLQVWDPEEGRLLHHGINRGWLSEDCHLFESAQGRQLLATVSRGNRTPWNPFGTVGTPLYVWDLGEAPAREHPLRPAHKQG
jgi:WD40 repeat protein